MRQIHGQWWNLNSVYSAPEPLSTFHLSAFLGSLQQEGYTVGDGAWGRQAGMRRRQAGDSRRPGASCQPSRMSCMPGSARALPQVQPLTHDALRLPAWPAWPRLYRRYL